MSWMLPSNIAVLTGTLVLTAVYLYLYLQDRQKFLLVWTIAWAVYLVRFCFMLSMLLSRQTPLLYTGYHLSALVSGMLLLWGTHLFLGRPLPRLWIAASAAIGAWIAAAIALNVSFLAFALPNFILLAVIYIWTGSVLLRARMGAGGRIVGWTFIFWGVHKADYPFLRSAAWFAPWGYVLSSVIELTVAIGMLLVYFQKMKTELVEKEDRFRLFAENARDIIYLYRLAPVRGFEYVSPSVTELTGYTPAEHYADPDLGLKLVHPDDRELLKQVMKAPDGKRPLVIRWVHKNGAVLWTEHRNVPIYDDKGRLAAIEGIARDITERRLADAAQKELARERDRLLKQLRFQFERMPIGLVVVDEDLVIVDWNPAAETIFGFPAGEAVGKHVSGLIVPESVKPFLADFMKDLRQGKRTLQAVNENLTKDGRTITCEWHDTPLFDDTGNFIGVMGMVQDITERRRTEEAAREHEKRFREFLENMQFSAVMLDSKGRVTFCNNHFLDLTGWSREEVIGRNWFELFIPKDLRPGMSNYFEALVAGSAVPLHHEDAILTRKGEQRLIVWDNTLLRDLAGLVAGTASIGIDVTEHRKMEEQLRQAQKMEAVGQLAGGIAHDFNNILSAIVGYAHLLKMRMEGGDPLLANVEHILDASERAAALTHSLLAFSRKQAISIKPVDLNEVIRKMQQLLLRVIGEDIDMKIDLAAGALVSLVDAGQVEQVLMNLATNARDAMPKGGCLTIRSEPRPIDGTFLEAHGYGQAGNYAVITVSDTGSGMDEETRKKIFDPFFTTKETGKGTGLGLAMVYGSVKQHNGFIDVQSEPGKGTTFTIYLPLTARPGAKTGRAKAMEAESLTRGSATILLAEDDETLRTLSSSVLRECGYTVIEARDGEEAVRKFEERKEDIRLVILDVIMPKKSGKQAHDEIMLMQPAIKALFVSGYAPDIVRDKGMLEGGAEILLKPFSPQDLLKKAGEILNEPYPV